MLPHSAIRAFVAIVAMSVALGAPPLAHGLPAGARVILVADESSLAVLRVRDELATVALVPEVSSHFPLDAVLDTRILAIVRFHGSTGAAIWTPHTVTRRLVLRTTLAADSADVLGVRVAEALRILAREVDAAEANVRAGSGGPTPTPPLPTALPTTPPSLATRTPSSTPETAWVDARSPWVLGLDASVIVPGGGHRVGVLGTLRGRRRFEWVDIGFAASFPILGSTLEGAEGEAVVRPFFLGLDARLRTVFGSRNWEAGVGGGVAVQWLWMQGHAALPYKGASDHLASAFPYAFADLSRRLHRGFWLRAYGLLGASVPKTGIRFAGSTVGVWGAPLGSFGLGAEQRF